MEDQDPKSLVKECLQYFDAIYMVKHPTRMAKYTKAVEKGEGGVVGAGKAAREGLKGQASKAADMAEKQAKKAAKVAKKAEKALAKKTADIATKKAELEAAKTAAKKAGQRAAARKAQEEVLKKALEKATKAGAKQAAKTSAKQTAKITTAATAKSAAKKVPIISLVAGGIFGGIRLGYGAYYYATGESSRALQEVGKACGEVASGACGCVPGYGTAASLAIDAGLVAWDISNAVDDSTTETDLAPTMLKIKVTELSDAIEEENKYTYEAFLHDTLEITFKKIGFTGDEKDAATDAQYIYEMVTEFIDEVFEDGECPKEKIIEEMKKQNFSKAQISSLRALADKHK